MTFVSDACQIGPMDGARHRNAKDLALEPCLLPLRQRRTWRLVEPHLLRVERRPKIAHRGRRLLLQQSKIVRWKAVDHVVFTTFEEPDLLLMVVQDVKP